MAMMIKLDLIVHDTIFVQTEFDLDIQNVADTNTYNRTNS